MGQGEPETPRVLQNRSASGGVNTRVFPLDIRDDQAVELENVDTSTPGQRLIRQGTTLTATGITHGPILALAEYKATAGSAELLAVSAGGSLGDHAQAWSWDGTGTQFTHLGALTGYTGWDAHPVEIVAAFDVTVGGGVGQVAIFSYDAVSEDRWYYDGSAGLSQAPYGGSGSGTPNGQTFHYAQNRLFMNHSEAQANQHRLGISDVGRAVAGASVTDIFPAANVVDMGGQSKNRIVAIDSFRESDIVVFMSDRIEAIRAGSKLFSNVLSDWTRVVIHQTIGCSGRKAVANTGEDMFFADQSGNIRSLVRTINDAGQGIQTLPISDPIKTWIDRINPAARNRIVVEAFDRWLLVGLPIDTATEADYVFALDTVQSAAQGFPVWNGPWTGSNAQKPFSMTVAELDGASANEDKNPTLYVGSTVTGNGLVYRMFRGTDDAGQAITFRETTKRYNAGTLELDKSWIRLQSYAVGTADATMNVEANLDAGGWEDVGSFSLLGSSPQLPQSLPFSLGGLGVVEDVQSLDCQKLSKDRGKDIQFRFTATASAEVKFLGFSLFHFVENWDREPDG